MRGTKCLNFQPKQLGRESSSTYVCSSQLREASLQHMASMYITKPVDRNCSIRPGQAHRTVATCVAGSASRWELIFRFIGSCHRAQQQAHGGLQNQAGHINNLYDRALQLLQRRRSRTCAHHSRGCTSLTLRLSLQCSLRPELSWGP